LKRNTRSKIIFAVPPARMPRQSVIQNKTALHMKHISYCTICKKAFITKGTSRKTCHQPHCVNQRRRDIVKKYQQSSKYKEHRQKYLQSKKYKESRKKYNQTSWYKEMISRRRQTEKYKEYQRKYRQTEKYKAYQKRYQESEQYKAMRRKYYQDHKQLMDERATKWRREHPEQVKTYHKTYHKKRGSKN